MSRVRRVCSWRVWPIVQELDSVRVDSAMPSPSTPTLLTSTLGFFARPLETVHERSETFDSTSDAQEWLKSR